MNRRGVDGSWKEEGGRGDERGDGREGGKQNQKIKRKEDARKSHITSTLI